MSQTANKPKTQVPGWADFKMPKVGTAQDIRRGAAEIQTKATKDRKIFGENSLVDGGTKVKG